MTTETRTAPTISPHSQIGVHLTYVNSIISNLRSWMRFFTFFHPGIFIIIHPPLGFAF
jgi:hypothetical protein